MIQELLLLKKHIGETPLVCMDRYRETHPEYQGVKMTYAGRLDPIAHGLLVVLAGAGVHEKDRYNKLDKTYRCTALLGVATDTYDILGFPQKKITLLQEDKNFHHTEKDSEILVCETIHKDSLTQISKEFQKELDNLLGTFEQAYPPFSSKTVEGIALHERTRTNIPTVLPTHQVTVYENSVEKVSLISTHDLLNKIQDTISKVQGDFRQEETVDKWNTWGQQTTNTEHVLITFTLHVSSGTYIRGIVDHLGHVMGYGACIFDLERLQVGEMTLDQCEEV
jgi:tRNA pseudouridine(55) synthase